MPSKKKPSREDALRWAAQGEPAPSVLAWVPVVSPGNLQAARVVLGADGERAVRIAQSFARIEELSAAPAPRSVRNG